MVVIKMNSYNADKYNIYFDENNIPISNIFNDSYYSKSDGLLEAQTVFLAACGLPNNWHDNSNYVIAELGFGTALNFLATMKMWTENKPENSHLHFVSFEQFPLDAEIAKTAHENWPEILEYSEKLIKLWPAPILGIQRIEFKDMNISLTLVVGDANETMKSMDFKADCWFLDGFAPSRNPELWSKKIFYNIKRLSKPQVRIGTYTVAGLVRNNLADTGFEFEKKEGFANKRERLEAWLPETDNVFNQKQMGNVAIIGAGVAGSAIAYYLKKRGFSSIIFDDDIDNTQKASGNRAGLIMPRLDRTNTKEARFFREAYINACNMYAQMPEKCFKNKVIKEIGKSNRDFEKYEMFKDNLPLSADYLEVGDNCIFHKKGGIVYPQKIIEHLSDGCEKKSIKIDNIEKDENGLWQLFSNGEFIGSFDNVFIASGTGLNKLLENKLPLNGKQGVVSIAPADCEVDMPLAGRGYVLCDEDAILFGATFEAIELDDIPEVSEQSHIKNLEILNLMDCNVAKGINIDKLDGRASTRVISKDKLPIVGKLDDNLFVLGALGSRGFSTAHILAQSLICKIFSEPMPIEKEIFEIIDVERFKQ